MTRTPRFQTLPPILVLAASIALLASLAGNAPAAERHAGLPAPKVELLEPEVIVPFEIPEDFPVPVVEVTLNGAGPLKLAVDTAMGGTILLRKDVAQSLGLPIVGRAMVGDSSGTSTRPADLIRIETMRLGSLEVAGILGIGFAAGDDHLRDVPDDLDGILGNQIYAELLATLDYPNRVLRLRKGSLEKDQPGTTEYVSRGGVMVVDLALAGTTVEVIVDSGHRGTINLPRSAADRLPLSAELRDVDPLSTVSATYQRQASRLDGDASLAGIPITAPELFFSDESTPRLIGYGVLRHFAITIDQRSQRIRFQPATGSLR